MNKRRRPPSEQRAERANRILAEMVIRGPRAPRTSDPNPNPNPAPNPAPNPDHRMVANGEHGRLNHGVAEPKVKTEDDETAIPPPPVPPPPPTPSVTKPVALSLVDFSLVLSLVFGGCCSNVYTYEYLLKLDPHLGTALTFSQMLFVTLNSLPSFLVWYRPNWLPRAIPISIPTPLLRPRQVPLSQWALQVLVLTTGSLLNNWAFGFQVPLTVQIIFRSAGLAVSMLFGRLFLSKRYSPSQIAAVLLVTLGVILATTSRPTSSSKSTAHDSFATSIDISQYSIGVSMLTVSLLLTGVLGLLQERTYTRYGPCWREGVFYTHALSLPIFLVFIPSVKRGFRTLNVASAIMNAGSHPTSSGSSTGDHLISRVLSLAKTAAMELINVPPSATFNPRPYTTLLVNLVTQLVCVSGVNQMTSRISSVSTNIVLTTRKAISLCFSVWWFGNGWNAQLGSGAGLVFLGSVLYALVTSRSSTSLKAQAGKGTKKKGKRLEREANVKLEYSPPPLPAKGKGKGKTKVQ